jgi:predicted nucleotidyltransferase
MNVAAYAEGWRRRVERDEATRAARAANLTGRAQAAARALGALGARRVVLFGSVAERRTHARSDIDLAVEGLDAADYFRAYAAAEDAIAPGPTLDLVRIEEAPPRLRQAIGRGEVLLER